MQIEFSKIFNKFLKISLVEAVEGGRPTAAVDGSGGGWFGMVIRLF